MNGNAVTTEQQSPRLPEPEQLDRGMGHAVPLLGAPRRQPYRWTLAVFVVVAMLIWFATPPLLIKLMGGDIGLWPPIRIALIVAWFMFEASGLALWDIHLLTSGRHALPMSLPHPFNERLAKIGWVLFPISIGLGVVIGKTIFT